MRLKNLMKLYSNAGSIDAAIEEFSWAFEQLDDFLSWVDFKDSILVQTAEQKDILENAIFAVFPASVQEAKLSGFDSAKEFFDCLLICPDIVRQNRQRLSSLLRDLKTRQKNNLDDDLFKLSANDLQKLFKKVPAYDI